MLDTLGTSTYIDFSSRTSNIPDSKTKILFVKVAKGETVLTNSQIAEIATSQPGSTWYVGGEPNVSTAVDDIIEDLEYYYTEIRLADPTARITSPSILNWDFTCYGCGGYQSGVSWMTEFVGRYETLYGELPPWDVWAIDVYPLDWLNLPNTGFAPEVIAAYSPNLPPANQSIPAKQIAAYRQYIDSLPGRSGDPIIVTEIGMHWGWSEISFSVPGCVSGSPAGQYHHLVVRDYFDSVFSWLEQNAGSHNIEQWFTYTTYADIGKCRSDGYSGMSLLDSPGPNVQLSDIGRWYVSRSAP